MTTSDGTTASSEHPHVVAHGSAHVVVIGAGPAGLMAAEVLSQAGISVAVYDAMPSVGRKFLLAGKGGLNLTHSEPPALFNGRFGSRSALVAPWLQDFGGQQVRDWANGLGVETFVGTSGRVFPSSLKAAPLLRAWLHRLRHPVLANGQVGVQFHMRHRWTGWAEDGQLTFDAPQGRVQTQANAVVLALGGGSWARLGSDGAWVPLLAANGVALAPLLPSNCGFDVAGGWSEHFASRFAGQPFKSVAIQFSSPKGKGGGHSDEKSFSRKGEFVATATGVEGSVIYAASALLRDEIAALGSATLYLDLLPDFSQEKVLKEVMHPRGSRSLSSHLKSRLGIEGIKAGILHEALSKENYANPEKLASAIKALPIVLSAARPIDEAISSAGGVTFEALDDDLMVKSLRGVFCAGEMLDWEAPTGGYLLTACLASGRRVGQGVLNYLGDR